MVASSAGAVTNLERYDVNKAVEYIQTSPTQPSVPDRFQLATTSHTISGGTLSPGGSYVAQIWHCDVNVHDTITLGAPTVGQTSYISRTSIQIAAVPEPSTTAVCFGMGALAFAVWRRHARGNT